MSEQNTTWDKAPNWCRLVTYGSAAGALVLAVGQGLSWANTVTTPDEGPFSEAVVVALKDPSHLRDLSACATRLKWAEGMTRNPGRKEELVAAAKLAEQNDVSCDEQPTHGKTVVIVPVEGGGNGGAPATTVNLADVVGPGNTPSWAGRGPGPYGS